MSLTVLELLQIDPDPVVGLAPAAVIEGQFAVPSFQRVRGTFRQDVAGTLVLEWRLRWDGPLILSYTIPQDTPDQAEFTYDFDVIRQGRYLTYRFTNGGAPSTYLRAELVALTD
jgi:hypothetical protein